MGRLPQYYAGKPIGFRIPYSMPGELLVANQAQGQPFPDATFLHTIDKPFEIHRAILRCVAFDNQATPVVISPAVAVAQVQDLDRVLEDYLRVRIEDTSKNERLTKAAQTVSSLQPVDRRTWEWDEPYTLAKAEGLAVTVDSIAPATFAVTGNGTTVTIANIRLDITFEGFLIVIAPASETR